MSNKYFPLTQGPTQGWGVKRRKPACLCVDGETYSNECCQGYLWNQGIGRTRGSNPRQQNLITTTTISQGMPRVFILGTNVDNSIFQIVWQL
jgi:hypothetical protein